MKNGVKGLKSIAAAAALALLVTGCTNGSKLEPDNPPTPTKPTGQAQTLDPVHTESPSSTPSSTPSTSATSSAPAKHKTTPDDDFKPTNVMEGSGIHRKATPEETLAASDQYLFGPREGAPGPLNPEDTAAALEDALTNGESVAAKCAGGVALGQTTTCTAQGNTWEVALVLTANNHAAMLFRKAAPGGNPLAVIPGRYQVAYVSSLREAEPTPEQVQQAVTRGFEDTNRGESGSNQTQAKCVFDDESTEYVECQVTGTKDGNGDWYGVQHVDPAGNLFYLMHQSQQ